MRTLMTTFVAAGLSCGSPWQPSQAKALPRNHPGLLLAQQQSPSNGSTQNSQDVPHQQPGTDSPDLGKQRAPTPKQTPGQNNPAKTNPSEGSNDVPHQQPGTDSPDLGKQRQAAPGTTGTSTQSTTTRGKSKRKKNKSTASQTQTSTQS